jgi:hypothetical protein
MRTKLILICSLSSLSLAVTHSRGEVVRAPLVGQALPGIANATVWLSETRIVNPNSEAASISVTDVVGVGNPPQRSFTIPPNSVLDLRNFELFFAEDPPASYYPPLLALVEFTSDLPVRLLTQTSATISQGVSPGIGCAYPPHFGGDCFRPLAGPLLRGFRDYVAPGAGVQLDWLTSSFDYRNNVFLTNPSNDTLNVTATYRSVDGETFAETYQVAPRSLRLVPDVLRDEALMPRLPDGAVTATFVGDQPFYVFAAVLSEFVNSGDIGCKQPMYALVQPEPVP